MSLISELKRRNVLRIAAAYVVTAWLIIQVVETIFPIYGLSDAAIRYVITGLAVGFVPVVIVAWAFELTPAGLKRDSEVDHSVPRSPRAARKLDRAIMVVLALALGYFAFDKFVLSASREADIAEVAREEGRSEAVIDAYGERSIAVLAFDDMSPDRDQEYMSDGIAEEILNLLAKVPDIRVISRSSALSFKGKDVAIPAIAAQLDASYILEGSVRKAGDRLRITAQLIDARSDTHRWSETYDRAFGDVFDIQDEIAAMVVDELKSALLGHAPKSQRVDEAAYTTVLQARYLWNRRREGDEEQALELYGRAVAIDPDYAPAWTGLSVAYAAAALAGRIGRDDGLQKARDAVDTAIGIDPEFAEAWVRLGQALNREQDYAGSISAFNKAFELDPTNPLTLGALAQQAGREGRIDDVVRYYDSAAAADPLGAIWATNKASWLIRFRRPDEAEPAVKRAFELNGNQRQFRELMTDIHNLRGEYEKALEMLEQLPAAEFNLGRKAIALWGTGRISDADAMLAEFESISEPGAIAGIVQSYAVRGDNDRAFAWLEKLSARLSPWAIVYDAYIRALSNDPRWRPFVDSLDWPWDYTY